MKTERTTERIREFLGEDCRDYEVTFKGLLDGRSVYLAKETETDDHIPTGLPVYILSTGLSHRFADPDETLKIMNGAASDISSLLNIPDSGPHMDTERRCIAHILEEDLSKKPGTGHALSAIRELYQRRRENYVRLTAGQDDTCILKHDAYIVIRNCGKSMCREVDDLLFSIDEVACHIGDDCIVFPYFRRKLYEKEVVRDRTEHPGEAPEDPLILVYDDEIDFETLLAAVNRPKSSDE